MNAAAATPRFGRRLATIALLGALAVTLMLAVPALRPVVREIRHMSVTAIAIAIALELASCLSFVVIFRLFFDRLPAREARLMAWTEMSSGALLPGGGAGGLAIGGWLMSLTGASTDWIIRRSSALFFLTTAVNSAAIIVSSILLLTGVAGPHEFLRAGLPLLLAAPATLLVAALPWALQRRRRRAARWLGGIVDGIADAEQAAARPSWRLLGAIGYLFCDIAVLWTTFAAVGHVPSAPALILGYTIGYLANALPIPGGIGVLDAGLTGALLLYGASPAHAVAAVLVYHAIAFWIPALGGVLAYGRLRSGLLTPTTAAPTPPQRSRDTSNPIRQGVTHVRTRAADRTHPQRTGRVLDRRPRTRPLPQHLRPPADRAQPRQPHPRLAPDRAQAPPPPRVRTRRITTRPRRG
jgi:uncharacterized membrane protein YbhN (UPF0104 family)